MNNPTLGLEVGPAAWRSCNTGCPHSNFKRGPWTEAYIIGTIGKGPKFSDNENSSPCKGGEGDNLQGVKSPLDIIKVKIKQVFP